MRVQFSGAEDREDVKHVSLKSNGDVVLRFSDHKETVGDEEYSRFEVSGR